MFKADDIMPPETTQVFGALRDEPLLSSFVLIGGTALALYLGHRKSEDLDFITLRSKLPRAAISDTIRKLEQAGMTVTDDVDPAAYDDFAQAGMQLRDYSHSIIVEGQVKVTFFTADDANSKILRRDAERSIGPRVAELPELCALKAVVAANRSNSRDWLDLFILAKHHGFGLQKWKEAYDTAGLTAQHFEIALNRICSGKLVPEDPGFSSLLPDSPSIEAISSFFRELRDEYEKTTARTILVDGKYHSRSDSHHSKHTADDGDYEIR